MKELLKVEGLRIYAGGRPVTLVESLDVGEGEVVLVTGPSGSGKTSFLRCIAEVNDIFGITCSGYMALGIDRDELSYIPQEPWFGMASPYPILEVRSFSNADDYSVRRYAKLFNVEHILESNSMDLSAGEIQRILFIESVLSRSKLVLVDEVTAYLDEESRKQLVNVIEEMRSEFGVAFIVVDHDVELWSRHIDKVLYLEPTSSSRIYYNVDETPLMASMDRLRAEVEELSRELAEKVGEEPILKLYNVWFRYPDSTDFVIKGVNIDVKRSEMMVIRGPSGKGKSTLLKIMADIYRPKKGVVLRYAKDIQYIPENPLLYLSEPTPRDELMKNTDLAVKSNLIRVLDTPIMRLSSGEKRRLAVASALARGSDLILLDEPSVGLDAENFISIFKLLIEAVSRGVSIVTATHSRLLSSVTRSVVQL
ncbi:MAG: ATP-binding cassette domain-containing protein [Ignisphaera sp.]